MGLVKELDKIANSIANKTGQPSSTYKIGNMAQAIDGIVTDFPSAEHTEDEPLVLFYDYDGTVIYKMNLEEAHAITSMPELPKHEGMVAERWTHELVDIQNVNHDLDVGIYWTSDDERAINEGATVLNMTPLCNDLDYTFSFTQTLPNGVKIDWGDGSAEETVAEAGAVSVQHVFAVKKGKEARYKVVFTPVPGCYFSVGTGSASKCFVKRTKDSSYPSSDTPEFIGSLNLGNCSIAYAAFYYINGIRALTYSTQTTQLEESALNGTTKYIKHLVLPFSADRAVGICGNNNLETIVIPPHYTSVSSNNTSQHEPFRGCSKLKRLIIPDRIRDISYVGTSLNALETLHLPASLVGIGQSSFSGLYSLKKVEIPYGITSMGTANFNGLCADVFEYPDSLSSNVYGQFSSDSNVKKVIFPRYFESMNNAINTLTPTTEELIFTGQPKDSALQTFFQTYIVSSSYTTTPKAANIVVDFTKFTSVPKLTGSIANMPYGWSFKVPNFMYDDFINDPYWGEIEDQIVPVVIEEE